MVEAVECGLRISALFAQPVEKDRVRLWAILSHDSKSLILPFYTDLKEHMYPSISPRCAQAHWFEREIFEQWGVKPDGHPWLKPIRFHSPFGCVVQAMLPWRPPRLVLRIFSASTGEEIHEVAVGPVHAGIIEPGHFRFQCHGEDVFHLEISLGYQHRGIERVMPGGPDKRTIHYMETLAGDTSVGHSTDLLRDGGSPGRGSCTGKGAGASRCRTRTRAHCKPHRGPGGTGGRRWLPPDAFLLRANSRRCAQHDRSHLREPLRQGLIRPGGVGFDVGPAMRDELLRRLEAVEKDLSVAVNTALEHLVGHGAVRREQGVSIGTSATQIGLVGPAARSCGADLDIRRDMPLGIFQLAQIPVSTWHSGDVFARGYVRWLEIQRSIGFIREQLNSLPDGAVRSGSIRLEV